MYFDWNKEKNETLKRERNISFEEVVMALEGEGFVDRIQNPSKNFSHQKAFVVRVHDFLYYVPFIEEDNKYFLKTIIPSRKILQKYKAKS